MAQHWDLKTIYAWPIKRQSIVFVVLFVVVVLVGFYMDISTVQLSLQHELDKENELKQQFEQVVSKAYQLKVATERSTATVNLLKKWQAKMVDMNNLPDALNDLLEVGATNHLQFSLVSPGDPVVVGMYEKIPLRIMVVGDYHNLGSFISQIANLKTLIVISGYTISLDKGTEQSANEQETALADPSKLVAEIHLDLYYLPEKLP
jgi:type IV pilus assembly protein PilO